MQDSFVEISVEVESAIPEKIRCVIEFAVVVKDMVRVYLQSAD